MVKQIKLFVVLFLLISTKALAQANSTYELQRQKINALLAERSAKFGQYDESLNARTGIFGFQTKKDIRNSNEILRQIAITDNEIFTQLKVLMDYKDLQVEEVKTTALANSESISNYKQTIKELQDLSLKLTQERDQLESKNNTTYFLVIIFFLSNFVLAYLLYQKNKKA